MAIFMSQAELERVGTDVGVVVARAEAYIVDLQQQLETQRARADAAAINVEQTCGLIEQKFLSLTDQYAQLEQEKESTTATLERRSTELAQAQAHCHRLELEAVSSRAAGVESTFWLSEQFDQLGVLQSCYVDKAGWRSGEAFIRAGGASESKARIA